MSELQTNLCVYQAALVASFRRPSDAFGGFSNMARAFPIVVNGHRMAATEALYQACRFPHAPDVQRLILEAPTPMQAKSVSAAFRAETRADWDSIRIPVMAWCLRVKLAQHWTSFGDLLLASGEKPIVEVSGKDGFWGAIRDDDGRLIGCNVLGKLLVGLRDALRHGPAHLRHVSPLTVANFRLLGEDIRTV